MKSTLFYVLIYEIDRSFTKSYKTAREKHYSVEFCTSGHTRPQWLAHFNASKLSDHLRLGARFGHSWTPDAGTHLLHNKTISHKTVINVK